MVMNPTPAPAQTTHWSKRARDIILTASAVIVTLGVVRIAGKS